MQPVLIFLPVEARNRRTVSLIEAFGLEKTNSELHQRRVWAVPEGGVNYRDYDFSQADVICFGPDKEGADPWMRPEDDRITIEGLPWPIYVDQAMAIIFEHVRGRK